MKILCGIDSVVDKRLHYLSSDSMALQKICHPSELVRSDIKSIATVFSLKEAVFKALSLDKPMWLDVEVTHLSNGKAQIFLSENIQPQRLISLDCSTTHEAGITTSIVVILVDKINEKSSDNNKSLK